VKIANFPCKNLENCRNFANSLLADEKLGRGSPVICENCEFSMQKTLKIVEILQTVYWQMKNWAGVPL